MTMERVITRLTGLELMVRRKSAGLTQAQLAARMGTRQPRVAVIEGARLPSRKATAHYLAALDMTDAGDIDVEAARAALAALDERLAAMAAADESDRP
jgi:transcriptional regulator with XRE-family HTH domain